MLGGRASSSGLEQPPASHERNDRQHLGGRADLENWEQVGVVVPENIAGHGHGVVTLSEETQGELARRHWIQDLDVQTLGVVLGKVGFHLLDELGVMSALGVQPEHGGSLRRSGPANRQRHPVANGRVLGLAGSPDVAHLHFVRDQNVSGLGNNPHGASLGDLESLVVRPVFLGFLRHKPNIGAASHGGGVECAVRFAVVNHRLIHPSVTAVRDDALHFLSLALRVPHATRVANHGGHGGIDDDVTGHVQVGDALVAVHHRHSGRVGEGSSNVSLDLGLLRGR
mmetsp:Transcript_18856/g.21070  ORF Transcript_18856/g.21070 Transcript_18856/m.21070 type:complete len:283 (-) Transcript_18856:944-1792(-)